MTQTECSLLVEKLKKEVEKSMKDSRDASFIMTGPGNLNSSTAITGEAPSVIMGLIGTMLQNPSIYMMIKSAITCFDHVTDIPDEMKKDLLRMEPHVLGLFITSMAIDKKERAEKEGTTEKNTEKNSDKNTENNNKKSGNAGYTDFMDIN